MVTTQGYRVHSDPHPIALAAVHVTYWAGDDDDDNDDDDDVDDDVDGDDDDVDDDDE
jgi:hypothetical protein